MHYKKIKLTILLLFGISLINLKAQETISSAGGDFYGSEGSVSFTIGQIFYSTTNETYGSVAAGIQQPFEVSVISAIEGAEIINLQIETYPNPTSDYLKLVIGNYEKQDLFYHLFDMNGRLIERKNTEGIETTISLINLPQGTYILKITQSQKDLKTFKIIKN